MFSIPALDSNASMSPKDALLRNLDRAEWLGEFSGLLDTGSIDATIEEAHDKIRHLLEFTRQLKEHRNTLVPISRLPAETFSNIFLRCAPHFEHRENGEYHRDDFQNQETGQGRVLAFTHVCRRWRHLALENPLLWNQPDLTRRKLAKLMLARAATVPIDLYVRPDRLGLQWYLDTVPQSICLGSLTAYTKCASHAEKMFDHLEISLSCSSLEHLNLFQHPDEGIICIRRQQQDDHLRHLRTLSLTNCVLDNTSLATISNLTRLSFSFAGTLSIRRAIPSDWQSSLNAFVQLLKRCPLQTLKLEHVLGEFLPAIRRSSGLIHLEHLTQLTVSDSDLICELVPRLKFPKSCVTRFSVTESCVTWFSVRVPSPNLASSLDHIYETLTRSFHATIPSEGLPVARCMVKSESHTLTISVGNGTQSSRDLNKIKVRVPFNALIPDDALQVSLAALQRRYQIAMLHMCYTCRVHDAELFSDPRSPYQLTQLSVTGDAAAISLLETLEAIDNLGLGTPAFPLLRILEIEETQVNCRKAGSSTPQASIQPFISLHRLAKVLMSRQSKDFSARVRVLTLRNCTLFFKRDMMDVLKQVDLDIKIRIARK